MNDGELISEIIKLSDKVTYLEDQLKIVTAERDKLWDERLAVRLSKSMVEKIDSQTPVEKNRGLEGRLCPICGKEDC